MNYYKYLLLLFIPFALVSCDLFGDMEEEPEPMKALSALWSMDKIECEAPCEVGFTNFTVENVDCEWDFGDGSIGDISCNTVHTFATAGEYEITLKVTDEEGNTASSSQTLNVTEPDSSLGHPFSGIKLVPGNGNIAAQRIVEVPNGFIMLVGNHMNDGPLSTKPAFNLLVQMDHRGEAFNFVQLPTNVIGIDMVKTLNDRILIAGTEGNFGMVMEIDHNLNTVKKYTSNLEASAFTSLDYNGGNEIYAAGYQTVGNVQSALVQKISSSFFYLKSWQTEANSDSRFDNIVTHQDQVFLNAYIPAENKSIIYNMQSDLEDANALVVLSDSNITDIEVDDERVYAAAIGPAGSKSRLAEFTHDLLLLDEQDISAQAVNNALFPLDLQIIDGHYLLPSLILNPGEECQISSSLQKVCTTGNQCASNIITCPENQTTIILSQIIQLENEEYLAVGTSSDADQVFDVAYLMLDNEFNLK